jgi:hypothetical protein
MFTAFWYVLVSGIPKFTRLKKTRQELNMKKFTRRGTCAERSLIGRQGTDYRVGSNGSGAGILG